MKSATRDARICLAIKLFGEHGIDWELVNPQTGHFHCHRKSDDKLFQYYAGTGKIVGCYDVRGIYALIALLEN